MERIKVEVYSNETNELTKNVAQVIAGEIIANNTKNKATVLGLTTGNSLLDVYREFIRLHKECGLDFSRVISFNLDEYFELPPDHENSYNLFMNENLFSQINIKKENIHIPQGLVPASKIKEYCDLYEEAIQAAGGIDIQLLGIGRDGHIGFNEPLSPEDSLTRLVNLDPITLNDAVREFGDVGLVPTRAITMGVKTIMQSKRIILIATGDHKASIIKQAVEEPLNPKVVASYLQKHKNTVFCLDEAAASELTRIKMPWVLGPINWSNYKMRMKAVSYLLEHTNKPINSLHEDDFTSNNMESLIGEVSLNELQSTALNDINNKILTTEQLPSGKNILVFAPLTADDVMGMGGSLQKLIAKSNKISCIYMTTGASHVLDFEAQKFVMEKLMYSQRTKEKEMIQKDRELVAMITAHINSKKTSKFGLPDIEELVSIKTVVRQAEAAAACNHFNIPKCEFMNGPTVEKTLVVLERDKPDLIFACGDLNDPNSVHRSSLKIILEACKQLSSKERPELWLYRVYSKDYQPYEADIVIPLSIAEVEGKIIGSVYHQSQNYRLQAGSKQLWQKIEERSQEFNEVMKRYGVIDYAGFETFQRHVIT
jgi:glucosamine-6-phosphate deaminase